MIIWVAKATRLMPSVIVTLLHMISWANAPLVHVLKPSYPVIPPPTPSRKRDAHSHFLWPLSSLTPSQPLPTSRFSDTRHVHSPIIYYQCHWHWTFKNEVTQLDLDLQHFIGDQIWLPKLPFKLLGNWTWNILRYIWKAQLTHLELL